VARFFTDKELFDYDWIQLPYLYTKQERGE
jgi:hypothetical protein